MIGSFLNWRGSAAGKVHVDAWALPFRFQVFLSFPCGQGLLLFFSVDLHITSLPTPDDHCTMYPLFS